MKKFQIQSLKKFIKDNLDSRGRDCVAIKQLDLNGNFIKLVGNCSHFNSIFGDILLIGVEMEINEWNNLKAGDDALSAKLFKMDNCPDLAFECHQKLLNLYIEKFKK